jgi:hypothetical protein
MHMIEATKIQNHIMSILKEKYVRMFVVLMFAMSFLCTNFNRDERCPDQSPSLTFPPISSTSLSRSSNLGTRRRINSIPIQTLPPHLPISVSDDCDSTAGLRFAPLRSRPVGSLSSSYQQQPSLPFIPVSKSTRVASIWH